MQGYSNPDRENDPHSLPDIEVFYVDAVEASKHEEEMTDRPKRAVARLQRGKVQAKLRRIVDYLADQKYELSTSSVYYSSVEEARKLVYMCYAIS